MVENTRKGIIVTTMTAGILFCSSNAAIADGAVPDAPKPVAAVEAPKPAPVAPSAPSSPVASSAKVIEWQIGDTNKIGDRSAAEKAATDKAIADFQK